MIVQLNSTSQEWSVLKEHDLVMIPVLSSHELHRVESRISFIYIRDLQTEKEYIVNQYHNDYEKADIDFLTDIEFQRVFVYKKAILHELVPNSIDIELIYWLETNEYMELIVPADIYVYHRWYAHELNINDSIPIMNCIGVSRSVIGQVIELLENFEETETIKFFNNITLPALHSIENVGLSINSDIAKIRIRKDVDKLYTSYNIFTSTGRPSNAFGGINFAALNKDNGDRAMVICSDPRGLLIEFDYDSYHVNLVGKLIKYDFPNENLHLYFGRQYFEKNELTQEEYEQSKGITFRLLYGFIPDEFLTIPFYASVNEYREKLWSEWISDGYVEMPISKRRILKKNWSDMTPNKLFNYVLQGFETEVNSLMIRKIQQYLLQRNSELVLYTYDSFLFDYNPSDGKTFIHDIKSILESFGFNVKLKVGKNYHNMITPNKEANAHT